MDPSEYQLDTATRRTLEQLPVPMCVFFIYGPIWKLLAVSDGLCQLLQLPRELMETRCQQQMDWYIYPEDREMAVCSSGDGKRMSAQSSVGNCRLQGADGGVHPVSYACEPQPMADGGTIVYVSYMRMDTGKSQDRIQSRLARTENLLTEILNATTTAVFWKDAQRRFLGANQAFLDYYGFPSVQSILGRTDEDMGWHTNPDPYKNDELQVLTTGQPTKDVHGQCMRQGENRDIIASKRPLYENGRIVGLVGSFKDVTIEYGQRLEIGRLHGENIRLAQTINHVPSGIAVYRQEAGNLHCIATNQYFIQQMGWVDIIGRSYDALEESLHPEERSTCRQVIDDLLTNGGVKDMTFRVWNRQKSRYIWFHVMGKLVPQKDGSSLIYASYTDITAEKLAEKTIESSHRLYDLAVNAAHLVVWEYDIRQRRIIFADNEYTRYAYNQFGMTKIVENVPESLLDFFEEKDRKVFQELYARVDRGESASCEVWFRGNMGSEPLCEQLSYFVVYDEKGVPSKAYGIGRNITAQKKAADKYRRELQLLQEAGQPNLLAKGHHDLSENRILEYVPASPNALAVSRTFTYDEALNALAALPLLPADQEKLRTMLDRKNLIRHYYAGERTFTLEYQRSQPQQAPIWVSTTVNTFAPDKNHIECFIYTYDLTNKVLERKIISRFTALGYDYFGLIDVPRRAFTFYSQGGMDAADSENHPDYDQAIKTRIERLVPAEKRAMVWKAIQLQNILRQLAENATFEYTFDCYGSQRELLRKRLQCCYLDDGQNTVFFCLSDITWQYQHDMGQMAQLQQALLDAERANEAKSMFLASISHDMRTPLNGILGFTDFALRTDELEKKQDYLHKIKLSGTLLLSLINDTLELSRIESGKVVLEAEILPASELLESIVIAVQAMADEKQICFLTDFARAPQGFVRVDRLKFQEIVLNLLSNAMKFTLAGGEVSLVMESLVPPLEDCNLRIIVRDNGIGISREFMPKLFEPFTQEHSSQAGNVMGTGLGLSIVRRIVALMGGTIAAESTKGIGTTFTVDIPLEVVESSSLETLEQRETVDLHGRRVLLFEDNYLNAEIARTLLEEKGVQVVHVENGQLGVELFQDSPLGSFDAILMDIRMPVMDGYEATAAIRCLSRADAKLPIIAMTADAYAEDIKKCRAAGMDSHVAKPIDPAQLFSELSRVCRLA